MDLRDAVCEGVSKTSGVITSAGLILAGTFAVLASLPLQILVQFWLITALSVLLDTFVVRPFLVPALTAVLENGHSGLADSRGEGKPSIQRERDRRKVQPAACRLQPVPIRPLTKTS